ncbi:DUF551 domain-containing protein [Klebsiella quasipneumoniae]
MLLNVCGAAFELADDSCQQDVDGEDCHVVPDDAFQKLSDALDEIENTLPTEDIDRPDVFLAWSAMPRAALKSLLQAGNSPVIPDGSADMLRRWLAFSRGMQNAGCQLPHNLIAETEAMLAAAPQSPGGDHATVPGKWIPVSERMPEDEQEVLTINKMGHRFVSFFDKHSGLFFDRLDAPAACCIEHVLVTHWMPLPAAPQEVKSE